MWNNILCFIRDNDDYSNAFIMLVILTFYALTREFIIDAFAYC